MLPYSLSLHITRQKGRVRQDVRQNKEHIDRVFDTAHDGSFTGQKVTVLLPMKSARTGCTSAIQASLIAFGFLRPFGNKRPKVERHCPCIVERTKDLTTELFDIADTTDTLGRTRRRKRTRISQITRIKTNYNEKSK